MDYVTKFFYEHNCKIIETSSFSEKKKITAIMIRYTFLALSDQHLIMLKEILTSNFDFQFQILFNVLLVASLGDGSLNSIATGRLWLRRTHDLGITLQSLSLTRERVLMVFCFVLS